jgi:hypothetical protein
VIAAYALSDSLNRSWCSRVVAILKLRWLAALQEIGKLACLQASRTLKSHITTAKIPPSASPVMTNAANAKLRLTFLPLCLQNPKQV